MTRPSKRTIISRQATAIHKRRRLEAEAEAESQQIAEPVLTDEVENEGEAKEDAEPELEEDDKAEEDAEAEEDDEAGEDDGDREAMHNSLQSYINTLQVHNGADSDSESEAAPLPEQPPQTATVDEPSPISQTGIYEPGSRRQTSRQQKWPRVSRPKRVEILKAGMRPKYYDCLHR
jgi:hypothetical protein